MKYILSLLILVTFVACGGGSDTPADNGNGNPNPDPINQVVQQILDDCASADVELLMGLVQGLADLLDSGVTQLPVTVESVVPEEGLIRVLIETDGTPPPDLMGLLTVVEYVLNEETEELEPAGPPASIDFTQFEDGLDGFAQAIANSTGILEVSLAIEPGPSGVDGSATADVEDGDITGFDAQLSLLPIGDGCAVHVQIDSAAPTAFDGEYPDLTADVRIETQINGEPTAIEATIVFDGTSTAQATINVPGFPEFTLPINLDEV